MKRIAFLFLMILLMPMLSSCMFQTNDDVAAVEFGGHSEELSVEQSDYILSQDAYLPIGTVVTFEDDTKEVMIIGVLQYSQDDPEKLYDYSGVDYPVGIVNPEKIIAFDKSRIESVLYRGYWNEDQDALQVRIEEALSENGEKQTE